MLVCDGSYVDVRNVWQQIHFATAAGKRAGGDPEDLQPAPSVGLRLAPGHSSGGLGFIPRSGLGALGYSASSIFCPVAVNLSRFTIL